MKTSVYENLDTVELKREFAVVLDNAPYTWSLRRINFQH